MTKRRAEPTTQTYGVVASHPVDLPDGHEAVPGTHVELAETDAQPLVADGHLVPIVPSLPDPVETDK